jgi:hypothetical protein
MTISEREESFCMTMTVYKIDAFDGFVRRVRESIKRSLSTSRFVSTHISSKIAFDPVAARCHSESLLAMVRERVACAREIHKRIKAGTQGKSCVPALIGGRE